MELDASSTFELLTALVMFAMLCWIFYNQEVRQRENERLFDVRRMKDPREPVSLWKRARIAMNPGRLSRWSWTYAPATVKQTFVFANRVPAMVANYPELGFGLYHPYKVQTVYGFALRYRYVVRNVAYWGEHRHRMLRNTEKEAREIADAMLDTEITIRYDPDCPEDSQAVLPALLGAAYAGSSTTKSLPQV